MKETHLPIKCSLEGQGLLGYSPGMEAGRQHLCLLPLLCSRMPVSPREELFMCQVVAWLWRPGELMFLGLMGFWQSERQKWPDHHPQDSAQMKDGLFACPGGALS